MSTKILKFPSKEKKDAKALHAKLLKEAEQGDYTLFHLLAEMYESGRVIRKDVKKALDLYKKFCTEYRKHRVTIDLIDTLMKIGHLYMAEGNKYRAAESYIEASLQIIGDYKGKERDRAFKKYKVEKFLKKTGYEDLVL